MNTGSLYEELTRKIQTTRRREQGIQLQAALLNALAAAVTIWTVAISLEAIGEFGTEGRTAIYFTAVALSGLLAAWLMALPAGRYLGVLPGQDDDTIAHRVGRRIPQIGDRLVNTLQLYRMMNAGTLLAGYSSELAEASIGAQGEPLRRYDYSIIIDDNRRTRGLFFLIGGLVVLGSLFLAMPRLYGDAIYRLSHYGQEFVKPAPFSLQVEPGDRQLVRGDSVEIVVRATGIPPRTVQLSVQIAGEPSADVLELRSDSAGIFHYLLPGVKSTTTYFAASGPVRTPEHTLSVIDRPEIRSLHVSVTAPSYTGRGTDRLPDNMGDVSGLRGSKVNVEVTTNIQPTRAEIVQLFPRNVRTASIGAAPNADETADYDSTAIPMKIDGTNIAGEFRLTRDGEYYIRVESANGLSNTSPIRYGISVSSDGNPSITLVQPGGAVDIDETMLLPTQVHISDDYGFSRLSVRYKVTRSQYEEPWKDYKAQNIPIPKGNIASLDVPYVWDVTRMSMVPGDELEIYFEVADNDVVSGPKIARTVTVKVRFPSLEDVLQKTEESQTQANAELDKVLRQAQDAKKQMEELNRELMKQLAQNRQSTSWQEQQKLQDIMKQHDQMEQKIQQIAENLREMAEKLREAKAISPETIEKYQELQKLFEELKSPDLMKAMQEMQKAMEKMTPEQLAEAMKNFKFNEEQFRQAIERTMKILQRMQTEQKVDELIRRADELAQKQNELNEMMKKTQPQDAAAQQQLADRQQQLAQSAEKMKQETEELTQKMNEMGEDMPKDEMQQAQQQLEQDAPQEQMQQAGQQMQQGEMQQAQQQGKQAKQGAENFKQKMQDVKQKMQQNTKREVMNKMRRSLQDLLDLSKRQEALKQQTEQTQPNSQQFRDQAQQESQMQQDMQNIADQLGEVSQKSFAVTPEMGREMGDAMRQMQNATQSLSNRDGFKAQQQQGNAMGAMNRSAMMMQQALAQMEGQQGQGQGMGQGMGSFQQRLQEMAAQQQMINEAMRQQMGEGTKGQGKDGKGQGEGEQGENGEGQMKKLQQQQGQVKKSVEELNKEMREEGGTKKNQVGDLDRASREIDEVLSDMNSGQVTPETLDRQERILSRMLDAMKSQRERDFEKKRESKPGVDVVRSSPPELKLGENEDQQKLQRDMIHGREQGYTKDYEYMIRKYFDALGGGNAEIK